MFSQRLTDLVPYTAGEQPQDRSYVKLNTNENPYPPSPRVAEALAGFPAERLRLYPDPFCTKLRAAAADAAGVKPENVFVGNGSDEVLSLAFFSFFDSRQGALLFPHPSYSFYPVYCDFYGIACERIPLEPDFSLRPARFLEPAESCGIVFPNPNAPTGVGLSLPAIRELLESYPTDRVVLIDEAYIDFGGESALPLCSEHPNLLIVQTLSKSRSLAGIRLGFAFGQPPLIEALMAAKDSFNSYPVDAVAQEVGIAALRDREYYRQITERVTAERTRLSALLTDRGWTVLPSQANFVLAGHPHRSGHDLYRLLKERGILVRHFQIEEVKDFVRITIGRPEQSDALIEAIDGLDSPG